MNAATINFLHLKAEFLVGVGFDKNNYPILPGEVTTSTLACENILMNFFGAFTRQSHFGGWRTDSKEIREPGLIFYVVVDNTEENSARLTLAQSMIRDQFRQASVALVITTCSLSF